MFAENGKKENLLLAIVLIVFFAALSVIWYGDYQEIVMRPAYEEAAQKYGAEVVQYYREVMNTVPPIATGALAAFGQAAVFIGASALSALIALAVLRLAFRQQIKFRALFSVMLYTSVIAAAASTLSFFVAVSLDSTESVFNLSVLIGSEHESVFLNTVASVSVFEIIQYVAIFFAVSKLIKGQEVPPSGGKAAAAAVTCAVALFAISFTFGLLSSFVAGSANLADTINTVYQRTHTEY